MYELIISLYFFVCGVMYFVYDYGLRETWDIFSNYTTVFLRLSIMVACWLFVVFCLVGWVEFFQKIYRKIISSKKKVSHPLDPDFNPDF